MIQYWSVVGKQRSRRVGHLEMFSNSIRQRDMMKAMLEMVKWSEKDQYVTYFYQLDAVGKSELPCVKAIQESYASKVLGCSVLPEEKELPQMQKKSRRA